MAHESDPNRIGATIGVENSDLLADLDPTGLTLGTVAYVTALESDFTLTLSTEALVTDQIVAVKGIDGYRWKKGGGAGEGNAFLDSTPNVYASPAGDNSNHGTEGSPVKTLYRATEIGIELGGANIYFTDQTSVGGPVDGQGLWLRNDNVQVPGWLNYQFAPLRYFGVGNEAGYPFERPGAAAFLGGGGTDPDHADWFSPALWVIGEPNEISFEMYNAKTWLPPAYGVAKPVNLGWDYVRRSDGSLEQLNITSGVRTGTSTTYTVDLSTATPYTMLTASRITGSDSLLYVVATVQLPNNIAVSPWYTGAPIHVVTSDANFPSVDAIVHAQSDSADSVAPGGIVTVVYQQNGALLSDRPVTGGTIRTHGLQAKERVSIDIHAPYLNTDFVQLCTVRVTAVTTTTVTVNDVWPYGSDTTQTGAIGTMVKQERARHQMSGASFYSCSFWGRSNLNDDGRFGPTVDHGGTNAHPTRFFDCFLSGFSFPTDTDLSHVDQDRAKCGILADAGASTQSGSTVEAYRTQSINAGLRWYSKVPAANLFVDDWLQDSGGGSSPSFPIVSVVEANGFVWLYINRTFCADTTTNSSIDLCAGLDPLRTHIGLVDAVESLTANAQSVTSLSQYIGGNNIRSGYWNDASLSPAATPTPWQTGNNIIWPGGLSTQHRGINRTNGVVAARFANTFDPLSNWDISTPFPTGVTVSAGFPSPDGGAGAIKINNASGGAATIVIGAYPHTFSGGNGDRIFLGAWMNSPSGVWTHPSLFLGTYDPATIQFNGEDNMLPRPPLAAAGWQWLAGYATVTGLQGGTTGFYSLDIQFPVGITYLWAPCLVQIPASVSQYDADELMANFKHQPLYLAPGMSGTMEGTKVIAHGGLGTAARYTVGVASGQITLTGPNGNAVELFDESGNSQGVSVLQGFTVNP